MVPVPVSSRAKEHGVSRWPFRLFAFFSIIVAIAATSQSSLAAAAPATSVGTITGKVTDRDSGAPVSGVVITVGYNSVKLATMTGPDGMYTIANVPAGQAADVFGFRGGGYRYHNSIYDDGLHIVLQPGQTYTYNFTVYQLNDPAGEPNVSNAAISPLTAAAGQTVTMRVDASGGKGGLSDEVIAASPQMGRMVLLAPIGNNAFSGAFTIPVSTPPGDYDFMFFAASNDCYDNHVFLVLTLHVTPAPPSRYFSQTGFAIDNDAFWNYFNARGGVETFGYPISRTFLFEGFQTQFFQRQVMQLAPDKSVRLLNLLDPGLLPYNSFNFSTAPAFNPALVATLPAPGTPGYGAAVNAFIAANAPETFQGLPTGFHTAFTNTVPASAAFPSLSPTDPQVTALLPLIDAEIWGVPTSAPAFDPNNHNFVYLRWQHGIMQYDATCKCTQGVLLADYLKEIITGKGLPADVAAAAAGSPLFNQYNSARPQWLNRPTDLPGTDLTNAFEPEQPS